jgi:hypothetical protein
LAVSTKYRSSIGLSIRLLSAFSAFRALLPTENYSVSDLVRCSNPLHIVMAIWCIFFTFKGSG